MTIFQRGLERARGGARWADVLEVLERCGTPENVARETRVALGVGAREREMGEASMGFSEESNMYLRALGPLSSTTLTHIHAHML